MTGILLAFATDEGQTEKIAGHVAKRLEAQGLPVVLHHLTSDSPAPNPASFSAVILAGSIHMGRHQSALETFASVHGDILEDRPNLMISVSLSAGSVHPTERAAAGRYMDMFSERTGFSPDRIHCAAGAIRDAKTPFLRRLLVHAILAKSGIDLNPGGDTEFTDWSTLDAVIDDYVAHLPSSVTAEPAAPMAARA
ncbi:MAG: flavodoxin domain-containing protein [Pseudomonadota bacterium]